MPPARFLFFFSLLFSPVLAGQQNFSRMAIKMNAGRSPVVFSSQLEALHPILLDARERAEFEVSHLEGAAWVGYNDFDLRRVWLLPRDQPIVVYCSVGYRSSLIAERMQEAGFSRVSSLWGGIFNWYNEQRLVVNASGPTENIHPYNEEWSRWIHPRR